MPRVAMEQVLQHLQLPPICTDPGEAAVPHMHTSLKDLPDEDGEPYIKKQERVRKSACRCTLLTRHVCFASRPWMPDLLLVNNKLGA